MQAEQTWGVGGWRHLGLASRALLCGRHKAWALQRPATRQRPPSPTGPRSAEGGTRGAEGRRRARLPLQGTASASEKMLKSLLAPEVSPTILTLPQNWKKTRLAGDINSMGGCLRPGPSLSASGADRGLCTRRAEGAGASHGGWGDRKWPWLFRVKCFCDSQH